VHINNMIGAAQELHEMLAQEETLHKFSMLEQIDVKRAMACPVGEDNLPTHVHSCLMILGTQTSVYRHIRD
jgi:hypothetical protein